MPQAVYIGVFSTQPETLGNYSSKTIAGQRKQYWYIWHGTQKGEYIAQPLDVFPSLRGDNDPNGPRVIPSDSPSVLKEKLFRQNYKAESQSRIGPPPPLDLASLEAAGASGVSGGKPETKPEAKVAAKAAGNVSGSKRKTALDMAELTLDDLLDPEAGDNARRTTNRGYTLDAKPEVAWLKGGSAASADSLAAPGSSGKKLTQGAGPTGVPAVPVTATAAEKLDKVLRDDFSLHMTRYAKGRKKEAMQAFSRILDNTEGLVPAHKHAFTDFGRDLRRIRLMDLAEKFYQRARELAPDDSNAAFNLARVLFESGKYRKALEEVNQALELNPVLECAQKLQENINHALAKRIR